MPSQIPLPVPSWYRKLSRRRQLTIALSVDLMVVAVIAVGISVQMPPWLLALGWASLAVFDVVLCVIYVLPWRSEMHARAVRHTRAERSR
jgi:hypothetical protein